MNQSLKNKLGLRIKELRVSNNLTQEQLAEMIGMERTNLTRIESGKHFPSAENIEKLASALKIDINSLFDFGHIKNKQELIDEIVNTLKVFNLDQIQFIHKSIINLKSLT